MARASSDLRLTGRDLARLVTLLVPTTGANTQIAGVSVPGQHAPEIYTEHQVGAKRISTGGAESTDGAVDRFSDTQTARWIIGHRADVTPQCRLRDDTGQVWNISSVEPMGRDAFLELRCVTAWGR